MPRLIWFRPVWSESSMGTQSHCWFCHVAAHIVQMFRIITAIFPVSENLGILRSRGCSGLAVSSSNTSFCILLLLIWLQYQTKLGHKICITEKHSDRTFLGDIIHPSDAYSCTTPRSALRVQSLKWTVESLRLIVPLISFGTPWLNK